MKKFNKNIFKNFITKIQILILLIIFITYIYQLIMNFLRFLNLA